MIYKILTSVVFISEFIIAFTIFSAIFKFDRKINDLNLIISSIKPAIREISSYARKISEQLIVFAEDFKKRINTELENLLLKNLSKILSTLILWKLNIGIIKKYRKSKVSKIISKGFALLQTMV